MNCLTYLDNTRNIRDDIHISRHRICIQKIETGKEKKKKKTCKGNS